MTDKYAKPSNGTDRYAVVGNPISHSKSPIIHAAFAKQTNQNISYEAVLAPLDGFEAAIQDLITQGYKGVNVTVPFKFEAYKICTIFNSNFVELAGSVNTLFFNQDGINGDSTDGVGLTNDINNNLNIDIKNKRVLLIGAGGAGSGVCAPILILKPFSLTVANRTKNKADDLVKSQFGYETNSLHSSSFENLKNQQFDIIINATSTGLKDTALPISNTIFGKNCLAYDMMYGRETPFMAQARANGAQVADGLGMLVEQAAEAFYLWRGVRPETAPVIAMLRNAN